MTDISKVFSDPKYCETKNTKCNFLRSYMCDCEIFDPLLTLDKTVIPNLLMKCSECLKAITPNQ